MTSFGKSFHLEVDLAHLIHPIGINTMTRYALAVLAVCISVATGTPMGMNRVPWCIPRGGSDYAGELEGVKSSVLEKATESVSVSL